MKLVVLSLPSILGTLSCMPVQRTLCRNIVRQPSACPRSYTWSYGSGSARPSARRQSILTDVHLPNRLTHIRTSTAGGGDGGGGIWEVGLTFRSLTGFHPHDARPRRWDSSTTCMAPLRIHRFAQRQSAERSPPTNATYRIRPGDRLL